ncbi:prolipoprotein diacylglyceryl transferase [Mycolicibacter minnesotensis]|uniref:prolipoprotein diacylglyceryl transferase n=1 Tax=Mycolicibacter minnesotensis TaxID=1118379 RepID=UPI00138C877A|nr:prolipoprotein diacylglyceryl transferase [Mycolicibacter minnesotensis]BBY35680.1 hypothetical protein MMIN_37410 [Mycolicibacter minnesotensis]
MTLDWLTYFPSPERGVWHLGPVPIRAYALCIIIGIIAALLIGDRRWRARGGEPGVIYDIALWAVPFGLIGGRLYHLMTDWRTYFGEGGVGWEATPRIWDGGLGIWGAVALGGVGAWIGCRRHGIPLPAFGDAVAPGIVLAQAIGRIGNYFNQELYGRETTLPWGLEIFWREDAAGVRDPHLLDGVSTGELYKIVQPTFLYELLWNLVVFVVLIYVDRRFRMGHGRLFALYVAGYCIGRFGIELLRDDAATHIAGIRVNSFTSTFVFIGAVVYLLLATKGREDPEAIRLGWQPDDPGEPEIPVEAQEAAEPGTELDDEVPDEPDESDAIAAESADAVTDEESESPSDDEPGEATSDDESDVADAPAEDEVVDPAPGEPAPVEEPEQTDTAGGAEVAPEPDDDSTDVDAADDHTSDHAGPPAAAVDDADAADDVVDAEPDDAEGESDAAQDVEQRG